MSEVNLILNVCLIDVSPLISVIVVLHEIFKWIALHEHLKDCTCCYHIAGSARGHYEANTMFWLASGAGTQSS